MPSFDAHKNFSISTITSAPSPALSGTSLVVASGTLFPAAFPFNCTVWPTGTQPTAANAEIVKVTARATNILTIVRAQEGTVARSIVVGDQIALTITAKLLTDIEAALSHLSSDGLTFTGAVNGTTGAFSGAVTVGGNLTVNGKIIPNGGSGSGIGITAETNVLTIRGGSGGVAIKNNADSATLLTVSDSGIFTESAFGTHTFSAGGTGANEFLIRNTTAGTGNLGTLGVGSDTDPRLVRLMAFSSTFTPSGSYYLPSGCALEAIGSNGLSIIANNAVGTLRFFTAGGNERMRIHASGGVSIANTSDPGAGLLRVSGFGASIFSAGGTGDNSIQVRNTTAGTGNTAYVSVGNDADGSLALLSSYSSTYTPATNFAKANGTVLYQQGVGGLSIAAVHASGVIRFYSGGDVERMRLHASGGISIGNTVDPSVGCLSVTRTANGPASIGVTQSTAGTANYAELLCTNDAGFSTYLLQLSSAYTSSVQYLANGGILEANGTNGLSISAPSVGGKIRFYTAGATEHMTIHASGGVSVASLTDPGADVFSVGTWVRLTLGSIRISDGSTRGLVQAYDAAYRPLQLDGSSIQFFMSSVEKHRFHASSGVSFFSTTDPGSGILSLGSSIELDSASSGLLAIGDLTGSTYFINLNHQSLLCYSNSGSLDASFGIGGARVGNVGSIHHDIDSTGFKSSSWPTTASAANANIANNDYIRLVTSLRSAKHDIEPIALADARRTVMGLTGVLYRSAVDADQRQWAGFIADDVEQVNPDLAVYNEKGNLQSVTYDRVPAFLVPLAQDHEARLNRLEAIIRGTRS